MTPNTMTYEYYYALGKTYAKNCPADQNIDDMESHITNCAAYLKTAFRDGFGDQMKTFWPAWPYAN